VTATDQFHRWAETQPPADHPDRQRVKILRIDDVDEIPDPVPLAHGILNKGELAMLHGIPGCGKTFAALDLALAITGGADWAGHRTERGLVIYCALEGLAGFRKRIPAACVGPIPDTVRNRFFMVGGGVSLRDAPSAGPLIEAIANLPEMPSLIVIDTLARAAAGAEENSSMEMGRMIAACDTIRTEFGTAILLVHHDRKEGNNVYRGSTAIEGALDAMMSVTKTDVGESAFITVKSEKSKDGEQFAPITFDMRTIVLDGRDQWGRERTSVRLVPSATPEQRLPGWFRGEPEDYPLLETIVEFASHEPLTTKQLVDQVEGADRTVRRQLSRLVKDDYVVKTKAAHPKCLPGSAVPATIRGVDKC
jgi:AAA domain